MNKFIRYAVGLSLVSAVMVPFVASAQTVSQLQMEIQSLIARIQAMQQAPSANQNTSTNVFSGGISPAHPIAPILPGNATSSCHTFSKNLGPGSSGPEVSALQTALQNSGMPIPVTGNFGAQTAAAVSQFQQQYANLILAPQGLSSSTGFVGASTRAVLNVLHACGGPRPPMPMPPSSTSPAWPTSTPPTWPTPPMPIPLPTSTHPPVACPMFMRYCPYGGYNVVNSDGCNEMMCNPVPTSTMPTPPTSTPMIPLCPMTGQAPYCPYGSHLIFNTNGCGQAACNLEPVPTSTLP